MSNREDNTEREYRNSNAWGESLTDAQKCAVLDRMRRTTNWASVVAWASQEFGIPSCGRASYYAARSFWRKSEHEMQLRLRLEDKKEIDRELEAVGSQDASKLAAVLSNDVAAARAMGDGKALDRALRLYRGVASIVKDSAELQLKTQAEARAAADLALQREKFEEQRRRNLEAAEKLKAALTARPDGGIAPETRARIEEALNLL
jgi:hypothetical protein